MSRQPLRKLSGPAVPLLRPNLDTDVIIRIDRMVSTSPADLAPFAFESLRIGPDGRPDPTVALNDPRFSGSPILIGGTNFGCGSSREPAVWALMGMGIRCVIAASFGDIFEANCHQNGVLPVVLTDPGLSALAAMAADGTPVEVDLEGQHILAGGSTWPFAIGAMQKMALLEGLDDIDLALRLSDDIDAWERRDRLGRPLGLALRQRIDPKEHVMTDSVTEAPGPTRQLAEWAATLELSDIPPAVRERAKHLLLDGIGCALIGAHLPWSRAAVEAVLRFEGAGESPLIGWGARCGASAAALLNSTFIQGFELDDFHPLAPLHSTSLVIPALLATTSTHPGADGASFLTAAVAGFEVGPRVGLALHGSEMLSRGWHSGPVFGTHAAAAAAGHLVGLDTGAMEDALGMAATQSGGLMAAQFGAMSKRMQHGFAARNGMTAALLAQGGYTGIEGVFEQPYGGFLSTFGEGHDPDVSQITAELGSRWETERIVVKPYAAMGGLHAALDALWEIDARRPVVADQIEKIDVHLSHTVYHHGWWLPERPLSPTGAQMNVAYVLAVAVLDGSALIEQFSPARINADDVWALIPRIEAHHDPSFDTTGPLGRGQTRLRITFTDGTTLEASLAAARSALEPLPDAAVVEKFRRLTAGVVEPERSERILGLVLSLEELSDLEGLVEALAPVVRSPFDDGDRSGQLSSSDRGRWIRRW